MGRVMGDEARAYWNLLNGSTNLVFWGARDHHQPQF
jgi:hypothetical protein